MVAIADQRSRADLRRRGILSFISPVTIQAARAARGLLGGRDIDGDGEATTDPMVAVAGEALALLRRFPDGAEPAAREGPSPFLGGFYDRLAQLREYHARFPRGGPGSSAAAAAAAATASSGGAPRYGRPEADGYDLRSSVAADLAAVRAGDLYSPEEVFGRYLDLDEVRAKISGGPVLDALVVVAKAEAAAVVPGGGGAGAGDAKGDDDDDDDDDDDEAGPSPSHLGTGELLLLLSRRPLPSLLPEAIRLNHRKRYVRFLAALYDYLLGFLRRTRPLLRAGDDVVRPALKVFDAEWGRTGGIEGGWEAREAERILAGPVVQSPSSGADGAGPAAAPAAAAVALDLGPYPGPQELLDARGADVIKAELSRIGLKCGGAPLERAKRLLLTKGLGGDLSGLPSKVWAKGREPPPPPRGPADSVGAAASGADDSPTRLQKKEMQQQQQQQQQLTSAALAGSSRRIDVARLEAATQSLLDQLRPTLDRTVLRAERGLYQTPNEREIELDEEINGVVEGVGRTRKRKRDGDGDAGSDGEGEGAPGSDSDTDGEDEPIYNPKGVPLGWDGKPIPYWLFKLHGLNHFYPCEICGGESYRGRHNFEKHFQEAKHTYGMRCLGIPNTMHFHGVTKIEDAKRLWDKVQNSLVGTKFDGEKEEEYEDSHGNVLTRKTYEDLARQGLL